MPHRFNLFCRYYQAKIERKNVWYFVAVFRSFEHVMFDRTLDKQTSTFEFFVPQDQINIFLKVMGYFQEQKIATELIELPNRLSLVNERI